ncbi:MAG: branched-chain-amino-acid transaminase [Salinirussus sp.]
MATLQIYIDGEIVPEDDATISVFDHSFLYGDGVFEGIRVYDNRIFKLDAHLERLEHSARMVDIDLPLSRAAFKEAHAEVLQANPDGVTYLRPVISRGEGPVGIGYSRELEGPRIVIIPQIREPKYRDEQYEEGLALETLSIRRTPFEHLESRIKSNNYLNNILAKLEVFDGDADDGILLDEHGYVAEACAGNLFCVQDDVLKTPTRQNVLNGITRQTVLELADEEDIETREERLTPYDFVTADEAFLTSTMTEIAPITSVDGKTVGDGTPGPITRAVTEVYREYASSHGYEWR